MTGIPMGEWADMGDRAIVTGLQVVEEIQQAQRDARAELAGDTGDTGDTDPDDRVMSG